MWNVRDNMNRILKTCKVHGETTYRKETYNSNRYRCVKCSSEAVQRRRDRLKLLAVEYKGGCCVVCGYNKYVGALEFHHLDPNEKDFGIAANGTTRSFEKLKSELDKCICVCANCHREIHAKMRDIPL